MQAAARTRSLGQGALCNRFWKLFPWLAHHGLQLPNRGAHRDITEAERWRPARWSVLVSPTAPLCAVLIRALAMQPWAPFKRLRVALTLQRMGWGLKTHTDGMWVCSQRREA